MRVHLDQEDLPTVSIITVCYNSEATILDCIRSINCQSYKKIQHVIIDGGSTDRTLSIVEENASRLPLIISEKDNGIYDAMNKGLALVNGVIVGFLNSDDVYFDRDVITKVANVFLKEKPNLIWGDLVYVKKNDLNTQKRIWKSSNLTIKDLQKGVAPPHPSFFFVPAEFKGKGRFDLNYRLASDFDFMLRLMAAKGQRSVYIPSVLVKMRLGGETNSKLQNVVNQNFEILSSIRKNTGKFNIFNFIFTKLRVRLLQKLRCTSLWTLR